MEITATIIRIHQETPTVKSFLLDLGGVALPFLPGQWVDCFVDTGDNTEVGGFSITSSPLQKGTIELAIKRDPYGLPSVHLHERAQVGDMLVIHGGFGEFYYQREMGDTLVLIAGGIGITPLMSMLRCIGEEHPDVEVTLFYSARSPAELTFLQELRAMSGQIPRIHCIFTVTRTRGDQWDGHFGRIGHTILKQHLPQKDALYYLCGPPAMLEEIPVVLTHLGVNRSRIFFERWT